MKLRKESSKNFRLAGIPAIPDLCDPGAALQSIEPAIQLEPGHFIGS